MSLPSPVRRSVLLSHALCLPSLLVAGGVAAADEVSLPPIVITATRTEKKLDESPVRTEVVDRAEIARTHALTLKQALENVPGLQLREVHGKSGYEVSLQGLTADQVLVLIDGLPITASTGSTIDLSQYLLGSVERVEVVKGAASAQYGSAAMGGVINVITRRIQAGFSGSVSGDVGSRGPQDVDGLGRRQGQFMLEGGDALWRLRLSGDALDDRGFATDSDGWARQGDAMKRQQLAARASLLPSRGSEVWLDAGRYREDDEQRYTFYAPPNLVPQRKTERITRDRVSAGGEWTADAGLRLQLKGVDERYDSHSLEYSNDAVAGDRSSVQRLDHVGAQVDLPAWRSQLWQFGADARRETLEQLSNGATEIQGGNASRSSREFFVQDDVLLPGDWELVLGLRTQDDSDFGGHHAPKIALRAPAFDTGGWKGTLRASLGQGYRVPNLKERHYLFDHSSLGYVVIGNPNLQPESSDSAQLGLSISGPQRSSIELQAFVNRVKDLIETDLVNYTLVNGVAQYTYRNVARARTAGLETAFGWQPLPALHLNAGWTWTRATDLDSGAELTRRPRQQTRLGLDWQVLDGTGLSLRARHQGSELVDSTGGGRSPAWATLDLTLNHDLAGIARGLRAYAGVNNVFARQRDFADPNDFGPIAGRYVYLGLAYRFSNDNPR